MANAVANLSGRNSSYQGANDVPTPATRSKTIANIIGLFLPYLKENKCSNYHFFSNIQLYILKCIMQIRVKNFVEGEGPFFLTYIRPKQYNKIHKIQY